jgi:hypothetical protein
MSVIAFPLFFWFSSTIAALGRQVPRGLLADTGDRSEK